MFKCTECGLEYEIKPEYCDCGNNEFVITIDDGKSAEPSAEMKSEPANPEPAIIKESVQVVKHINIEPKDLLSYAIFTACIFLAFLVLFVWNPKTEETVQVIATESANQSIPPISQLWKESDRVKKVAEVKEIPAVNKAPVVKKPVVVQKPSSAAKPAVKKTQTKVSQTKTTAAKQTAPKSGNSGAVQKTTTVQPAANKPADTSAKTQTVQVQTPIQTVQTNSQDAAAERAKKIAQAQKEKQKFDSYKIELRNTIGRKIDFTKVIGDGECTIAFKINSNGKLINRSFEQQSSNMTLNDAVYNAIMQTPSYNPPPAGYKGELLRLKISFNNGNFSISLR